MAFVRVAIAQIRRFEPPTIDGLAFDIKEVGDPEAKTVQFLQNKISDLRRNFLQLYDEPILAYLDGVIRFCTRREVDVLVLPECSIKRQWLAPLMKSVINAGSRERKPTISAVVAGSHVLSPATSIRIVESLLRRT